MGDDVTQISFENGLETEQSEEVFEGMNKFQKTGPDMTISQL